MSALPRNFKIKQTEQAPITYGIDKPLEFMFSKKAYLHFLLHKILPRSAKICTMVIKKNHSVSNLHSFKQGKLAQLVERLGLDLEARVRISVGANFFDNK